MAQPPSYTRQKNFADDFGNETDHPALNAELDRASNSINDIRTNLAILQADDGKLRPAVVTADSISQELRVSLVEGVVMDAQTMLDKSLAAADASSASAKAAKASEEAAKSSSEMAVESAKALSLAVNSDWDAIEGPAKILNRPELSDVALSGNYRDLKEIPENLATDSDIALLQEEIAKKGVPVGTVEYFAMTMPPPGYLKADGAAVGRTTYPVLFAAIGTTFGEGDGETTFNLPDLIDRFAQGNHTPGQKVESGLPNITGTFGADSIMYEKVPSGVFSRNEVRSKGVAEGGFGNIIWDIDFDASRSTPIYGASDTVQPPALTLLPCIKAFDAATNPGLIDISGLANDVSGLSVNKLDKTIDGKSVKYVTETFNDGANWYRKWSDGWVEQGGYANLIDITLLLPMQNNNYFAQIMLDNNIAASPFGRDWAIASKTTTTMTIGAANYNRYWYVCGKEAQS